MDSPKNLTISKTVLLRFRLRIATLVNQYHFHFIIKWYKILFQINMTCRPPASLKVRKHFWNRFIILSNIHNSFRLWGKLQICIKRFMLISICLWFNGKSDRNQFQPSISHMEVVACIISWNWFIELIYFRYVSLLYIRIDRFSNYSILQIFCLTKYKADITHATKTKLLIPKIPWY